MSAARSLMGIKRTCGRDLRSDANEPGADLQPRRIASISVEYVHDFDILRAGLPWHRTRDDQQHEVHRIGNPASHRNPLPDVVPDVVNVGREGIERIAGDEKWRAERCEKQNGRTDPRRPSDIAEAPG